MIHYKNSFKIGLIIISVIIGCDLLGNWMPGVSSEDSAYWQRSKQQIKMRLMATVEESGGDVAVIRDVYQQPGTKYVHIWYDAGHYLSAPLNVSVTIKDGMKIIPAQTFLPESDLGQRIAPGKGKHIVWDAGADWLGNYSQNVTVTVNAIPILQPETWAVVTILWSSFGGSDVDVCGYWLDRSDVKVGWSWGTGSETATHRSTWRGDNTGSGPEYINIGVVPGETLTGVIDRRYRIHCNYYGSSGNPANVTIKVACNGQEIAKTISAGIRSGSKATISDPYVTIRFDALGNLVSIQ